jgi:hypothetical protein
MRVLSRIRLLGARVMMGLSTRRAHLGILRGTNWQFAPLFFLHIDFIASLNAMPTNIFGTCLDRC